jgi:hypothetical protein
MPILDESFFRMNTVHEISASRLLYSSLLNPEAEKFASVITNQLLDRGIEESELIEDTNDVKKLIDMVIEGIDSLNHEKMKNILTDLILGLIEMRKRKREELSKN